MAQILHQFAYQYFSDFWLSHSWQARLSLPCLPQNHPQSRLGYAREDQQGCEGDGAQKAA